MTSFLDGFTKEIQVGILEEFRKKNKDFSKLQGLKEIDVELKDNILHLRINLVFKDDE